jgi:hypothetical protein
MGTRPVAAGLVNANSRASSDLIYQKKPDKYVSDLRHKTLESNSIDHSGPQS